MLDPMESNGNGYNNFALLSKYGKSRSEKRHFKKKIGE